MLPQKKGEIPTTFSILLMEGTEFLRATPSELGLGLLFAYVGACSLLHRSSKEVATTKVQKLDEACVLFKQKQRSRMSVSLTCGIVFSFDKSLSPAAAAAGTGKSLRSVRR